MNNLLKQAKQFLSIVETSTLKDEEIKLLIRSAILELERSGIDTKYNYSIETEQFDTNVANKEWYKRTFNTLEQSLSLSDGYRKKSDNL